MTCIRKNLSFYIYIFPVVFLMTIVLFVSDAFAIPVFINEIHYDNTGGDNGEGIEVTGLAGTDLTGWRIALYRGSDGTRYNSYIDLSAVIPDQFNGFGARSFSQSGIRNSTGGIALLDGADNVIQFLSYEGFFTANDGSAIGMTSTDIGVSESSSTPIGHSLQLVGIGNSYEDFSWATPKAASFGNINVGQTFSPIPTPEPGSFVLMVSGLVGMFFFFRSKR